MSDDIEKTLEDIEALFAQTARELTTEGRQGDLPRPSRPPPCTSPTARSGWSGT